MTVALIVVVAALVFNSYVLFPPSFDRTALQDSREIIAGANRVHSFHDTLRWWGGTTPDEPSWIHTAVRAYRPLSSYALLATVRLGQYCGYRATDFVTFAFFVGCCLLVAALCYRFTRSFALATLAGVLATPMQYWFPNNGTQLLWFAQIDNFLSCGFILGSMITFLLWRETGKRRSLAATWLCVLCAIFAKELGLIAPVMLLALSVLPLKVKWRPSVLHAALMVAVSVGLFALRPLLIPGARPAPDRSLALAQLIESWTPPTPLDIFVLPAIPALKAIVGYFIVFGVAWFLWHNRRAAWAAVTQESLSSPLIACLALWTCVQLAYVPVFGYPLTHHYGYLGMMIKCVLWIVAAQGFYSAYFALSAISMRVRSTSEWAVLHSRYSAISPPK